MNKSEYRILLDLHDQLSPNVIFIKQGDTARELRITLTEDGKPYEVTSDCTVYLKGVLPDGTTKESQMVVEDNELVFGLGSAWTTTAGEIVCEVKVNSGANLLLISPTFSIYIA